MLFRCTENLHTKVWGIANLDNYSPPACRTGRHFSVGFTPPLWTKNKLGKLAVRRNPLIADLFHRIKYVEKMGTGLSRIKKECRERHLKIGIETNGLFIITFKRGAVNVPINERQRWLLEYLLKNKKININEFHGRFTNVSLKTIKRDFAYLRKSNIIKRVGVRRTGHYVLNNEK